MTRGKNQINNPYILNVQNGVLDLCTMELSPHNPTYLPPKIAATHYDSAATCPEFLKFLNMIFEGDTDIISYLQRCFGYSLSGLSDEKVILYCCGESGENGKTTLFNVVNIVLGNYLGTALPDLSIGEDIGRLEGLRCVFIDSYQDIMPTIDASLVKSLTGSDMIIGRKEFGAYFTFTPSFTIWVSSNEILPFESNNDPIWNRIKTIPFDYSIPKDQQKPMEQVMDVFRQESAGILNWMLDGWKVYHDQGKGLNIDAPEKIQ